MKVDQFYDHLSGEYTALLERSVPVYGEMIKMFFQYFPQDMKPLRILELGCGTGNLSELITKVFPDCSLTLVDISSEMINLCQHRLRGKPDCNYIQSNFNQLDLPPDSFDLVVSTISIHHLIDVDKARLFENINQWLKKKGLFIFSDQFKGSTDSIYKKNMDEWHKAALQKGASDDDWQLWMHHQENHDYHATVQQHFEWLKESGYRSIDIVWRKLLWGIIYSLK